MNELQKQRMDHLSFYIRRSLNNLSYDPIIRQMEKHQVSSSFTVERLIELFTLFVDKEKEEYIGLISRDIKNAKILKKSTWEALKEEMKLNEEKKSSEYERGNQLRNQLNSIQTITDSNQIRNEHERETSNKKITEIQNILNFYGPFINEIHYSASSVKNDLNSIRNSVKKIQQEFEVFLRNLNATVSEKIENQFILSDDQKFYKMKQKMIGINRSNQQLQSSMMDILSHINHKYNHNQLLLTTNSSNKEFQQVLKEISSPFPPDSEYRKASYIRNKIEDKCNFVENTWRIKIQKQQKRLNRLRSEFAKAEARLKLLLEADSCIDYKLLEELENQHASFMTITKNKTDNLMKVVLSQSTLTMINDDSELNLPFSNISSK
ncbi:hypothetical protein M9Y10_038130 [Tritrichomonas musculus]|uniref:Uncharacterized protein n=1 Tax=Tritrichomonas musculus TaxID=1915356 RepID=A0ABR2K7Q0_9EUKA